MHAKDGLPPVDPYKIGQETAIGEGKTKKEARATASARLLWELKQKEERLMLEKNRKK